MKYIKTYEDIENEPQVGDYVICDEAILTKYKYFFENNIGQIIRIDDESYDVAYDNPTQEMIQFAMVNIDKETNRYKRFMDRNEIIIFSPNREDIEAYIASNKYNL